MNVIKRINLLVLMSFCISSVSMAVSFDDAILFLKKIYTLEYLNGNKGELRNSSLFKKITTHPDRALMTVAVYGLSLFVAKKLFDLANNAGVFNTDEVPARSPHKQDRNINPIQDRHSNPIQRPVVNEIPRQRPHDRPVHPVVNPRPRPQDRPVPPVRRNLIHGNELHILNLARPLASFHHMESHTPYDGIQNSCGAHSVYNMARVEAYTLGRAMDDAAFDAALRAIYPQLGGRGMSNKQAKALVKRLGLSRTTLIRSAKDFRKVEDCAKAFARGNGAQVTHFLCEVPGHWIAISIMQHANGERVMYLYDNNNARTRSPEAIRGHVEMIYNIFFN